MEEIREIYCSDLRSQLRSVASPLWPESSSSRSHRAMARFSSWPALVSSVAGVWERVTSTKVLWYIGTNDRERRTHNRARTNRRTDGNAPAQSAQSVCRVPRSDFERLAGGNCFARF